MCFTVSIAALLLSQALPVLQPPAQKQETWEAGGREAPKGGFWPGQVGGTRGYLRAYTGIDFSL